QEEEGHVEKRAPHNEAPEGAAHQFQQSATSFRPALRNRKHRRQFGHYSSTSATPPAALPSGRSFQRRDLSADVRHPVLQRGFSHLRSVGVKLAQLLELLLDGRVALGWGFQFRLRCHGWSPWFRS